MVSPTLFRYTCPCCGYWTLEHPVGDFDICHVCAWEADSVQSSEPLFRGGPNRGSLKTARRNFLAFGASEWRRRERVRPPTEDEIPPFRAPIRSFPNSLFTLVIRDRHHALQEKRKRDHVMRKLLRRRGRDRVWWGGRRQELLRQRYGDLYEELIVIFALHDPLALDPLNLWHTYTYDLEVEEVLRRLPSLDSASQVRHLLYATFLRSFHQLVVGEEERFGPLAQDVWNMWVMAHPGNQSVSPGTRASYEHELHGDQVLRFIRNEMKNGTSLSWRILDTIDLSEGTLWAYLPEHTTEDAAYDFHCDLTPPSYDPMTGKRHRQEPRSLPLMRWVVQRFLNNHPGSYFVADSLYSDPFSVREGDPYVLHGDEVYYFTPGPNHDARQVDNVLALARMVAPHGVLTALPTEQPRLRWGGEMTDGQLEALSTQTQALVFSAYGGEGYVFWARPSFRQAFAV